MNFDKIFSAGYPQQTKDPRLFYTYLKNAHPRYKAEIRDVYFSAPYKYRYNGRNYMYGDVMASHSDESHYEYLMKIQHELNIDVSLTFNETYPNKELTEDPDVLQGFINHLGKFYEMGVRSCTISNVHLMSTGILQRNFPEMLWKNTVNHIIIKPQQVVDYHLLGYDVINLDRSLNRDLDALRAMQPLRKKYPNLILSLLATEGCMPNCAFKVEHDTVNKDPTYNYWKSVAGGKLSCNKWRTVGTNELPRIGTDIVWANKETFYEYAELVDYFKFSGRMGVYDEDPDHENHRFIWANLAGIEGTRYRADYWDMHKLPDHAWAATDCFQDLIENIDGPIAPHWFYARYVRNDFDVKTTWKNIEFANQRSVWTSKKGQSLNHVLKTCKNECWDCHACERTFGVDDFDSLIEINRDTDALRGHSQHFKGIPISYVNE